MMNYYEELPSHNNISYKNELQRRESRSNEGEQYSHISKEMIKKIIMEWCNNETYNKRSSGLEEENALVQSIYKLCAQTTKYHIEKNIDQWRIGGEDVIVVVDLFPIGLGKFGCNFNKTDNFAIIGFAEAKKIPPQYYFELINHSPLTKEDILTTIKKIVLPNTILVLDDNIFNYQLDSLYDIYPKMVSNSALAIHNTNTQNIFDNLKTIWENILKSCDNVRDSFDIENTILATLWNQKFGFDSEAILISCFIFMN